jgi:signal transduction histidine kinase
MPLEPSTSLLPLILEWLLSQTSDGMILLDRDGRILMVNSATQHLLHVEGESFIGRPFAELPLRTLNHPSIQETLLRAVQPRCDASICSAPVHVISDRGKSLLLTALELPEEATPDLGVWRYLVMLRESRVPGFGEEDLNEAPGTAGSHREATTDALASLAEAIAHEIRNPVMVIGGFARILQRHHPNLEHVNEIMANSQRLEAVVQEVTDFASLPPVRFQDADPVSWLQEVLASFEDEAQHHHVRLVFNHTWPENLELCFDQLLLRKVLRILFENSLQAMQGGVGEIRVNLSLTGGYACVEMVDTGRGIEPEHLPHIFGAFFTTKPKALGMGLTKAERILSKHGGRLKVEPAVGGGTRVRLWVPMEIWRPESPDDSTTASADITLQKQVPPPAD